MASIWPVIGLQKVPGDNQKKKFLILFYLSERNEKVLSQVYLAQEMRQ